MIEYLPLERSEMFETQAITGKLITACLVQIYGNQSLLGL